MEPESRREVLVELLADEDVARPQELAARLGVSAETIRRDLIVLEREGAVQRVHGGVALVRISRREGDPTERRTRSEVAKKEIAVALVDLVQGADSLALDVGTTIEAVAREIGPRFAGRVVTNSFPVASALERSSAEVHFLGGLLRLDEQTTYGADAATQMQGYSVDAAIIGCSRVDLDHGPTYFSVDTLGVRRSMIHAASQVYLVADGSKLGGAAFRRVCEWSQIDALVTDSAAAGDLVEGLRAAGIRVIQGSAETPTA